MWISDDELLALTTTNNTIDDCGRTLWMTDQGIPYTEAMDSSEARQRRAAQNHHPNDELMEKFRSAVTTTTRNSDLQHEATEGGVTSTQLAAWTQALTHRMIEMTNKAFLQTWMDICRDMKTTTALLRATIMAEPTNAVRTLLDDPLLDARAGNGFLEVWRCIPVDSDGIRVVQQTDRCTKEIPITFRMSDRSAHTGYLDPTTLIISHGG